MIIIITDNKCSTTTISTNTSFDNNTNSVNFRYYDTKDYRNTDYSELEAIKTFNNNITKFKEYKKQPQWKKRERF